MTILDPAARAARALLAAAILMWLPLAASAQEKPMILPVDPAPLVAMTDAGERRFTIEIADDPGEQQRGLMHRTEMADEHGMLFVLGETRPTAFWMENTPMPLDLVFIGEDGKVRAVLQGEPFSRANISPGEPVRFVLELKAGIAQRNGIEAGDRIRHPAIDQIAGAN
jgi:uncharacterized protein